MQKLTKEQRDLLVEHFRGLFKDPTSDVLKDHFMCIEGIIEILNKCTEQQNLTYGFNYNGYNCLKQGKILLEFTDMPRIFVSFDGKDTNSATHCFYPSQLIAFYNIINQVIQLLDVKND